MSKPTKNNNVENPASLRYFSSDQSNQRCPTKDKNYELIYENLLEKLNVDLLK